MCFPPYLTKRNAKDPPTGNEIILDYRDLSRIIEKTYRSVTRFCDSKDTVQH